MSSRTFIAIAIRCLVTAAVLLPPAFVSAQETLPPVGERAPRDFTEMWDGFDPRDEPLDIEVLKQWEDEGVVLRIVRFRIGVFKGQVAKLAAIYGFPKDETRANKKLPGLVQIHGGGQFADEKACLANAKRGYATLSLAWAGRISATKYRVSSDEVKLFWEGKTDDPNHRLTTDWGALDGYHAPGRNKGNVFPSAKAAPWTLDDVESPRNSGWFLCALAARRALTFMERQPEVDPARLGVYGHSMGGKLTVMTAVDSRVKAAAPSCGGISDRYNKSPLFRSTIGDGVSLKEITCPIIFLSPSNDFHGRIGDLPKAIHEIQSKQWRVTCSPHHNHQDTAEYEVATLLWMDQHLKGEFQFPKTPETTLTLKTADGVPELQVRPDNSKPILSVDVFFTQHGKSNEEPSDHEDTKSRFWRHATAAPENGTWSVRLPVHSTDKPLWAYANVTYPLDEPVSGAGYYYGYYTAEKFNLSSVLSTASPKELRDAAVAPDLTPVLTIEDFEGDWRKAWFSYQRDAWAISTHKLRDPKWAGPTGARLVLEVKSALPNKLVLLLDDHAAEVPLKGGDQWQEMALAPRDFKNFDDEPLSDWKGVRLLKLSPAEHLRSSRRGKKERRVVGAHWKGNPPEFRVLRWQPK